MIVLLCNIRLTAYLILLLFYHHGVNLLNSSSLSSKIFSGCIVTVGEVRSRWLLGSDGRSQGQWQTLYHTLDKPLYPTIPAPHIFNFTSISNNALPTNIITYQYHTILPHCHHQPFSSTPALPSHTHLYFQPPTPPKNMPILMFYDISSIHKRVHVLTAMCIGGLV